MLLLSWLPVLLRLLEATCESSEQVLKAPAASTPTEHRAEVEVGPLLPASEGLPEVKASLAPSLEVSERLLIEPSTTSSLSSLETLLAELVVYPLLLRVAERLVCVRDLLELGFGALGVVLVLVRMVPDCQLLERLLDLVLAGVPFDAQRLIVVLACERQRQQQGESDYSH